MEKLGETDEIDIMIVLLQNGFFPRGVFKDDFFSAIRLQSVKNIDDLVDSFKELKKMRNILKSKFKWKHEINQFLLTSQILIKICKKKLKPKLLRKNRDSRRYKKRIYFFKNKH